MEYQNNARELELICLKCGEKHICPVGVNFFTGFTKFKCKKCFTKNVYPMRKRIFRGYVGLCILLILGGRIPGFLYLYVFIKNKLIWKHLTDEQKSYFLNWDIKAPSYKIFSLTYVSCNKSNK